jgi:hypothetical protein
MMEAIHSSETSVFTRTSRRKVTEYVILNSHHCENLKFYAEFLIITYHVIFWVELTAVSSDT